MFKNRLTFWWAAITLVIYVVGLVYSALALFGHAELTRSLYLICLLFLAACSTLLFWLMWGERKQATLSFQIGIILWWGVVVWYWFFSPIYYLFVMTLNDIQLRWAFFSFVWVVSIISYVFILFGLRLFRPVQLALAGKTPPQGVDLYKRVVNYPSILSLLQFISTVFGFFVGTMEVKYFAGTSTIELWKNFANGFMISVFLGVIYYVVFQNLLGDARATIQGQTNVVTPIRGSIIRRMLVVFTLVVFGSLFLLQLILVRDLQDIISNSTIGRLQRDIQDKKWEQRLIEGGGKTFLIDQDPYFLDETFAPETSQYIYTHDSGVVSDSNVEPKIIAFFIDPVSGEKSILVVFMYNFYGALKTSILFFAGASLFVLLISIGIVAIITSTLTASIQTLTGSIRVLSKDKNAEVARISSGDEIEELSSTLAYFVKESRASDKAKDEFIAIASHQLRTPLTQLEWMVEALKKGDVTADIKEYFPDIQTSVIHLSELVNLLLNAHRLEENKTKLNTTSFDLVEFMRIYIEKYRPLAEHKEVSMELKGDEKIETFSDKAIFETIIDSIISNAIEYTPKKGSVTVTVRRQGDRVLLAFTDTGIGIPEETKAKIFQKFVRAHNALLVKTAGTGLGLYVAKQCVLILGGTIRFESELNKGTTFYVDLPVRVAVTSDEDVV